MAADGGDMVWLCRGNRGGSIVQQRGNKSHGCSSDAEVLGLWHEVARLNCHCWMVLGKNHTHVLKTPCSKFEAENRQCRLNLMLLANGSVLSPETN